MKEHPIIFSGPMVRAVLRDESPKTQTRRLSSSPLQFVRVGDRLWVRENFRFHKRLDSVRPGAVSANGSFVWREADCGEGWVPESACGKLRPSIFMPRWASRITLEVVDVRFERVHEISLADAVAEGATSKGQHWWSMDWPDREPERGWGYVSMLSPAGAFANYWVKLNGHRCWLDNPEVVALTFKRVS